MSLILIGLVIAVIGLIVYALGARDIGGITLNFGKWVLIAGIAIAVLLVIVDLLSGNSVSLRLP